jgi:carbon-monoxide dehydrogenase large subunit
VTVTHEPPSAGRFVGQSVQRKEDRRLLTGHGEYVDDIRLPRLLHAAFVRSPFARARILRVDTARAAALDGVKAVFTAAELNADARVLKGSLELARGETRWRTEPLAGEEAKFVGDPVALVVAESRYVAEDACDLVDVEFEALPAVTDYETAADNPIVVHGFMGTNVAGQLASPDDARLADAWASAAYVFEETFHQHRQTNVPMETRGVVADWEPASGQLRIWIATQSPHEVRLYVARMLGLTETQVHVSAKDVGGGFGQKWVVTRDEAVVVLAAHRLGRAVKWIEDRWENLTASNHAREERMRVKMAFDGEGCLTAAYVDHLDNVGAIPAGGAAAGGALACAMFPGPYRLDVYGFTTRSVFTNTCARGAYRGPWMMETVAREMMMDIAARGMGMDPLELRRRNVIHQSDLPYTTATKHTYDRISPEETLEQVAAMVGYESFRHEQAAARAGGRHLGLGLALYVEPCAMSFGALGVEVATVRVEPTGAVNVFTGTGSHGHSVETTMAQVVADQLGVGFEDVTVHQGNTDASPFGGGTGGSRTAVIAGGACQVAARQVKAKVVEAAAHLMEAAPEDLEVSAGVISVRGSPTRSLPLGQLAYAAYTNPSSLPPGMEAGLEATVRYRPPSAFTYSNAAHACVCEVDTHTGRTTILRYLVSEDCGVLINPRVVEGQIAGGVVQGIGGALYERMVYDQDGTPVTTTFMDYLVPTAAEVPDIEYGHVVVESRTEGGYKGMGEGGAIGSPPAVVNAVGDALAPLGITITDQPVGPQQVFDWIEAAGASD